MDKQALKNILYGSIYELANDKQYFYHSPFGGKYNHFTPEGEKAVLEILTVYVEKILQEEKNSLDRRAKELVIKGLKGDKD